MSPFIAGLTTGLILGTFAWFVLVILLASHRSPPPTLHRRFQGQALPDGVDDPARAQRGVRYEFMGIAHED